MSRKQNKELNTSCRITAKDGSYKEYNSIEEASLDSGLSIASIKIRCNSGSIGKDKHKCEWLDEHTKRSFQARRSKNKGNGWETEIISNLKAIGFTDCVRSAGESKFADNNKIDILDRSGKLPINIQAKNTQNLPNYFEIRDACTDKTKPMILCWKKAAANGHNSPGSVAIVPIDFFYELLSHYNMNNFSKND